MKTRASPMASNGSKRLDCLPASRFARVLGVLVSVQRFRLRLAVPWRVRLWRAGGSGLARVGVPANARVAQCGHPVHRGDSLRATPSNYPSCQKLKEHESWPSALPTGLKFVRFRLRKAAAFRSLIRFPGLPFRWGNRRTSAHKWEGRFEGHDGGTQGQRAARLAANGAELVLCPK